MTYVVIPNIGIYQNIIENNLQLHEFTETVFWNYVEVSTDYILDIPDNSTIEVLVTDHIFNWTRWV